MKRSIVHSTGHIIPGYRERSWNVHARIRLTGKRHSLEVEREYLVRDEGCNENDGSLIRY